MSPNFVMIGGLDPQRVPCAPDRLTRASEEHKHLCSCGACWRHSNINRGEPHAHTCPGCGAEVWHILHRREID